MTRLSRRTLVLGAAGLGLLGACRSSTSPAEPTNRVAHVGLLGGPVIALPGFRRGMAEFGYVDGQNLVIEHRLPGGVGLSDVSEAAQELVALQVDVIVAANILSVRGAKAVTSSVPIVAWGGGGVGDLIANELVASQARSGNNVTGLTVPNTMAGKRLQLLAEAVPQARRVAVLHQPPGSAQQMGELEKAAGQLEVSLLPVAVDSQNDLETAFGAAVRQQADGLFVVTGRVVSERGSQVGDLALQHRLPSMVDTRDSSSGLMMYYGPNLAEQFRHAAYYVDRILKGTKPADLPVEQPMTFDFVVNLKTAQALGITFPNEIMLQVTDVIQ